MEISKPIAIKDKRKRFDSIGTPESPFRILLLNLLKKTRTWVKNEDLVTHSCP